MEAVVEQDGFVVHTNTGSKEQVIADIASGDNALKAPPQKETTHVAPEAVQDADASAEAASEAAKALNVRKRSLEGRKQSIQEEINALVRQRGETQRERDRIASELESLRAERAKIAAMQQTPSQPMRDAMQPVPAASDDQEPTEDQFTDYATFVKAQARWQAREAIRAFQAEMRANEEKQREARWHYERDQSFAERLNQARSANPEFDTLVNREDIELSPPMIDVIKDSPMAPQLMLHLAQFPDEAQRIQSLHPMLAFGEMKKLEARVEFASQGWTGPNSAPKVSQARPPIRPVGSAPSGTVDDPSDMDFGPEYVRRMNAVDRNRRRL